MHNNIQVFVLELTLRVTLQRITCISGPALFLSPLFLHLCDSERTCFSRSSVTSSTCQNESSRSNKLKAFFEEDFGIETQENGMN